MPRKDLEGRQDNSVFENRNVQVWVGMRNMFKSFHSYLESQASKRAHAVGNAQQEPTQPAQSSIIPFTLHKPHVFH